VPRNPGAGGVEPRIRRKIFQQQAGIRRTLRDDTQEVEVDVEAGFERIDATEIRFVCAVEPSVLALAVPERVKADAPDAAARKPICETEPVLACAPVPGHEND
jgi:hypothetical protein